MWATPMPGEITSLLKTGRMLPRSQLLPPHLIFQARKDLTDEEKIIRY